MRIRTLLLVIALVAIAVFVALNWSAIMTPTFVSLGVATLEAPLGLLMLGLLTLFAFSFLVFVIHSKTSGFFKDRHHSQEMQVTQNLADNAETSRFTELRELFEVELKRQAHLYSVSTATVMSKLEQLDSVLRSAIRDSRPAFAAPVKSSQFGKQRDQQ